MECSKLKHINIPSSVKQIDGMAFSGCYNLEYIEIPSSVENIEYGVFDYCSNLKSIKVDIKNNYYYSENNCVIRKGTQKELIVGCQNSIIPTDISIIGDCAFLGCEKLTSIIIPEKIKEIGSCAFDECYNLKEVIINGYIEIIHHEAFSSCTNLKRFVVKKDIDKIDEIEYGIFSYCKNITIYCPPGSNVEKYAKENGIKFENI